MRYSGLVSQRGRRTSVSKVSQISRGDKSRNARLGRLRELVPVTSAIVGIDLADAKQMVVVYDHDFRVLARRTLRGRVWALGATLDWAADKAAKAGFTIACEPIGRWWRILGQLAAERSMAFVCVQPSISAWARRGEDLTSAMTVKSYGRPWAAGEEVSVDPASPPA